MFKHTGIVRRIDETGRLIIPKEIRRRYRIHDGDPIEIGEGEKAIVLKKYSVLELFNETSQKLLQSFSRVTGMPVMLCNMTNILSCERFPYIYINTDLTMELSDCLHDETMSCKGMQITNTDDITIGAMERICIDGTVEGALIIPVSHKEIIEAHRDCLKVCAHALAAFLE